MEEIEHIEVAIVGAGLAGLTAAYRLQNAGKSATVFEARPDRVGGRCWTAREFANGQTGEHGGERIDTRHREIIDLASELGLPLDDHIGDEGPDRDFTAHFNGEPVTGEEIVADQVMVRDALLADLARRGLSLDIEFDGEPSAAALALDAMSVHEWVEANIEGGIASRAGASLLNIFAHQEMSAYELIESYDVVFGYFIGDTDPNDVAHQGDEKYRVRGGNDLIPQGLLARLPEGSVQLGARLTRLARTPENTYRLDFDGAAPVVADAVVLALPFPALNRVDLTEAGFSDKKMEAIREFGLSPHAKLIMQFDRRPSEFAQWSGYFASEEPYFVLFENTGCQSGDTSIITAFYGGQTAVDLPATSAHGPADPELVDSVLRIADAEIPGIRDAYTGVAWLDNWVLDENTLGAYTIFRPGQYTRFWRVPADPEGSVFFAGEHTSIKHRGFLNGGVESGQRAAQELLEHLR